jgi:hypothetical protein
MRRYKSRFFIDGRSNLVRASSVRDGRAVAAGVDPRQHDTRPDAHAETRHDLGARRVDQRVWSGRRGSNSRHAAWKAAALPTELLPPGPKRYHAIASWASPGERPFRMRPSGYLGSKDRSHLVLTPRGVRFTIARNRLRPGRRPGAAASMRDGERRMGHVPDGVHAMTARHATDVGQHDKCATWRPHLKGPDLARHRRRATRCVSDAVRCMTAAG